MNKIKPNKELLNGKNTAGNMAMGVLVSLSICHCCNDTLQSVVNSLYPMIKDDLALDFIQIGIITLIYQMSASVLQPIMGFYLDRKPNPWFLTLAACLTFIGMIFLAYANTVTLILISVILIGAGSSIIHPEASRLTSLASGGKKGFAQSIFQVGGNLGGSLGPLLAALVIAPYGRQNTAIVALLAFGGITASIFVGKWYKKLLAQADFKEYGDKLGLKPHKHKLIQKGDPLWIPRPYSDNKTYFVIGV
ncbi:MAG: MFS transporter, partial [Bacteroidales bacterium]